MTPTEQYIIDMLPTLSEKVKDIALNILGSKTIEKEPIEPYKVYKNKIRKTLHNNN